MFYGIIDCHSVRGRNGSSLPLPDKWRDICDKYMKIKSEIQKPVPNGSGLDTNVTHRSSIILLLDFSQTPRQTISNVMINNNLSESPSTSSCAGVTTMETAKVTLKKKASQLDENQIDQAILKVLSEPSSVPLSTDIDGI
ncbi:hypothetical protein CBL_13108 [Carabus blaptoides fortunei]